MKKDKLILEVHKCPEITSNIVRIQDSALEVVKALQRESGLSASSIVSKIIIWSQDKIEIKEV